MNRKRPRLLSLAVLLLAGSGGEGHASLPPEERPDEELLVLAMQLGRFSLSEGLLGYRSREEVLLPLGEVARTLGLAVTAESETGQAKGWFLDENRRFSLDLSRGEVVVEGEPAPFDPDLVLLRPGDIYVGTALLESWFPVDFDVDLSRLLIEVTSREPLPVEQRFAREKKWAALGRTALARPVYPRVEIPYRLWDWPFIDVNLMPGYRGGKTAGSEGRFSCLASGDLLGMSSSLYLLGVNQPTRTEAELRLRLERKDPDGGLIGPLHARAFSVGDIRSTEIPLVSFSRPGRGVEVSNFPLSRRSEFDRITLQGDLPPGWEVELFRNDAVIDFQLPLGDGRYEFVDVPLLFGRNILRLVFHGPQGQRREEVRRIYVGPGLVRAGDQHYRLSLSEQNRDLFEMGDVTPGTEEERGARYSAEYERGIGRTASVTAALAGLPVRGKQHNYWSLGLRAAILGAFSRLEMIRDEEGGTAAQLATQTRLYGLNLFAEHARFSDFVSDRVIEGGDPVRTRSELRLDTAIPAWLLPRLSLSATGEIERRQSERTHADFSNRLSLSWRGISVSNRLNWVVSRGGRAAATRHTSGSALISGSVGPVRLRGQAVYRVEPVREFGTVALTGDWRIGRHFGSRLTISRHLSGNPRMGYSAGINHRLGAFHTGLSGRYEEGRDFVLGFSVSFGLAREPRGKHWALQPRRVAGSGAVSARVFLDSDQDGSFDATEEPLPGVRFRRGGGALDVETDTSGVAFIPGLFSYRPTAVAVDVGSLEDPYWLPTREGVEVVPRPGRSTLVEFAVTPTGEVDGTVYLRREGSVREAANVQLQLVNPEGKVVQEVKSAFDGFYLFTLVPPGRYTVRVSPEQVRRLNLAPPPEREVVIEGSGTIESGVDFTVEPNP